METVCENNLQIMNLYSQFIYYELLTKIKKNVYRKNYYIYSIFQLVFGVYKLFTGVIISIISVLSSLTPIVSLVFEDRNKIVLFYSIISIIVAILSSSITICDGIMKYFSFNKYKHKSLTASNEMELLYTKIKNFINMNFIIRNELTDDHIQIEQTEQEIVIEYVGNKNLNNMFEKYINDYNSVTKINITPLVERILKLSYLEKYIYNNESRYLDPKILIVKRLFNIENRIENYKISIISKCDSD